MRTTSRSRLWPLVPALAGVLVAVVAAVAVVAFLSDRPDYPGPLSGFEPVGGETAVPGEEQPADIVLPGTADDSETGGNRATPPPVPALAGLRELLLDRETRESQEELRRRLAAIGPEDLDDVISIFNGLPRDGRQHEFAFTLLMRTWAAFDGAGAIAFGLSAADDPGLRDEFYFATGPALQTWAEHDLADASATVAALAPGLAELDRNRFAIYLMESFASQDPAWGMQWIQDLGTVEASRSFAEESALAMARALVAGGEPERVREWLQSEVSPEISGKAVEWVALQTALESPGTAWEWLGELPDPATREAGFLTMISAIAGTDDRTIGFWIEGFRDGLSFDDRIADYVRVIRDKHPEAARAWAEVIEEPARRDAMIRKIGMR